MCWNVADIKRFLTDFYVDLPEGGKAFKYSKQLRQLANREQVAMCIDLNDLATMDQDLADACLENTKRYNELFYDAIQELLPEYKDKEVEYEDLFEIRLLMFEFRLDNGQRHARCLYRASSSRRAETRHVRCNSTRGT